MIFERLTNPRVIIGVMADEWVGEVIKVLVTVFVINVCAGVMIIMLSNVLVEVTIDVVSSDIRVEELTDVNVNVLVAMVTALYVSIPAPWEEPTSFCLARFSCLPMTLLDCNGALHAWIPSYHVCKCFALPLPQFLNQ